MSSRKSSSGKFPFFLTGFVLVVVAIYCGYWVWMSGVIKQGALDWVDDQRAMGREVSYSDLSVGGFPFRFVLEAENPILGDPDMQSRWEGDQLQMIAMSWNLHHIMVRTPGANFLSLPDLEPFTLTASSKSIASLRIEDGYLRRFGLTFPEAEAITETGRQFTLTGFELGLAPMPNSPDDLQFALSLETLDLPNAIPDAEWLGEEVRELIIWIEVEDFYPVAEGRKSQVDWRLDESKIHLRRGEIDMGPLDLASRASFTLDRDLNPDGTVGVHLSRIDELKAALRTAGLLTTENEFVITTIGNISKNDNFATVRVQDRKISLLGRTLAEY
ncbi:MAG: hypothetical protein CMK07_05600 [Ponticaulis sp.]|nr:hypothetical protein [Ponticaulis sp.]